MSAEQGTVFLHRAPGDKASVIGGGAARIAEAERVALQTAHGRVLVRSISRDPDGSFAGEVYAVMPREPHAGVGDHVCFHESQIFAFKVAEGAAPADADDEIAQMTRTFEESFGQFDAAAPKERPPVSPASSDASLFDMDISAVLQDLPASPASPSPSERPRAQPVARAPRAAQKDATLSTAEAVSILRAAEQKGGTARQGTVASAIAAPASAPKPEPKPVVGPPARPVAAPPVAPMRHVAAETTEPKPAESITPAARPVTEPVPSPPEPAAKLLASAPPRPVEAAIEQPRRVFQPGAAETKPVTGAPEPLKPAPLPPVPAVANAIAPGAPAHVDVPPAPVTPAAPDVKINCRECGSTLVVSPEVDDASESQRRKVSCRTCGRINEVKSVKS